MALQLKCSHFMCGMQGPTLLARMKLRQGVVHSLKGSWSNAVGPLAELKSRWVLGVSCVYSSLQRHGINQPLP